MSKAPAQTAITSELIQAEIENLSNSFDDLSECANVPTIGLTFGELQKLDLPKRDEIIIGLGRGEVAILNAVTNAGKTTLLRNLAVSLAIGKTFPPFGDFVFPRKAAILDFEDSKGYLRHELTLMTAYLSITEKQRLNDNLLIFCDDTINDETLSLSNILHLSVITKALKGFAPDLIIVDTIASAFSVKNENDNSEVKELIMRPLKALAKDVNAAVIASHHIGKAKSENGEMKEASHKGRGASTFADLSRSIFNLEKDNVNDTRILSAPKLKGVTMNDTVFKFDFESRWLTSQGESKIQTNYETFLEFFEDENAVYSTKEIIVEFDGVFSKETVLRKIKDAVGNGKISKISHGKYRKCQSVTPYSDDTLTLSDNSNKNNNLQPPKKFSEKCLDTFPKTEKSEAEK